LEEIFDIIGDSSSNTQKNTLWE